MSKNQRRFFKGRVSVLTLVQVALLLASFVSVAFFLRFHVLTSAKQFESDFKSQSFFELANGEIHIIARKLSAISKKPDLACVIGERNSTIFFEEKKDSCRTGFFRTQSVVGQESFGIKITFVHALPESLFFGFLVLFVALFAVGLSLLWAQREKFQVLHESELRLARLSRQIAHDLKSPLAAVRALFEAKEFRGNDLLRSTSDRLESLVNDLSGDFTSRPGKPQGLKSILESAVAEKKLEWSKKKQCSFELDCPNALARGYLDGDGLQWRRILSNLMNNSLEVPKSSTVRISAKLDDAGFVRIVITDDGDGIAPDALRRLGLSPFTQGKSAGKGIGLSSAFQFLERLGGKIELQSEVGKGTSISLIAPFSLETSAVLIDDDVLAGRLWAEVARRNGISLRHFTSSADIRSHLETLEPDTYFYLDLNLQNGESGFLLGEELFRRGFRNIFLSSGMPGLTLEAYPWAKGITGKEPPWLT